jgi:alkylated DNA repair dioxygenase AlkB
MTSESPIEGLEIIRDYFDEKQCQELIRFIEKENLAKPKGMNRRVIQYGSAYDYTKRHFATKIGDLPIELKKIKEELPNNMKDNYDQVIINEYTNGQFISAHKDSHIFDDKILTISLGDSATMIFRRGYEQITLQLTAGTIVMMSSVSRQQYTHEILPVNGKRYSITMRKMLSVY